MTTYTVGQPFYLPEGAATVFVDDAVPAPGSGNNATISTPAATVFHWIAIFVTLTTGPTAINRRVYIELSRPGGHQVSRLYANQLVPSSRTGHFFFMLGYPGDALALDSTSARWLGAALPADWWSVSPYGVVVGMEDNTANDVLYNIRYQALSYRS